MGFWIKGGNVLKNLAHGDSKCWFLFFVSMDLIFYFSDLAAYVIFIVSHLQILFGSRWGITYK